MIPMSKLVTARCQLEVQGAFRATLPKSFDDSSAAMMLARTKQTCNASYLHQDMNKKTASRDTQRCLRKGGPAVSADFVAAQQAHREHREHLATKAKPCKQRPTCKTGNLVWQ